MAHCFVDGATTVGRECTVFPFASVGTRTQDLKYKGGTPRLRVGDRTTIRECATVHTATADGDETVVGSDCLLMAYSHVAHDCRVGDGVILANCGTLAGHVTVEDYAILGGLVAVHQFVRVGRMSIVGGCSRVIQDVPPFMMAEGNPLSVHGLNSVGLQRRGVSEDSRRQLKQAYRLLYREGLLVKQAIERIRSEIPQAGAEVLYLLDFLGQTERGVTRC